MTRWAPLIAAMWLASCGGGAARPVAIDTMHDGCGQCRMIVSDVRLAGQIVAPGEEPRVFDDIGCLHDYLAVHSLASDALVFVADHRTGEWVEARGATYTRARSVHTPMGSQIVAHADAASRDADPAAAGGEQMTSAALFDTPRAAGAADGPAGRVESSDRAGAER